MKVYYDEPVSNMIDNKDIDDSELMKHSENDINEQETINIQSELVNKKRAASSNIDQDDDDVIVTTNTFNKTESSNADVQNSETIINNEIIISQRKSKRPRKSTTFFGTDGFGTIRRSSRRSSTKSRISDGFADTVTLDDYEDFSDKEGFVIQMPSLATTSNSKNNNSNHVDLTVDSSSAEEENNENIKKSGFPVGEIVLTPYGCAAVSRVPHSKDSKHPHTMQVQVDINPGTDFSRFSFSISIQEELCISDTTKHEPPHELFQDGDVIVQYNELKLNDPTNVHIAFEDFEKWNLTFLHSGAVCMVRRIIDSKDSDVSSMIQHVPMYEVRLLFWGTGTYFTAFDEGPIAQEKPKSKKRGTVATKRHRFESAWTPKAYLHPSQLKLAHESVAVSYRITVPFGSYCNEQRDRTLKITVRDLCRLWPGYYLNDVLIDFCFARILESTTTSRDKIHIFGPLFFDFLVNCQQMDSGYQRVKRMTAHVDIFAKETLFVPINDHAHWMLAMICFPNHLGNQEPEPTPYIFLFDSIRDTGRSKRVLKTLRSFFQAEWLERHGDDRGKVSAGLLPGLAVKVPVQDNQCDCGIYLVEYFDRIINQKYEEIKNIALSSTSASQAAKELENTMGNSWFTAVDIAKRRHHLYLLLWQLYRSSNHTCGG